MRNELVRYLEWVLLYLSAGYELGFAWEQTRLQVPLELIPELLPFLESAESQSGHSISKRLRWFSEHLPYDEMRMWFGAIEKLYQSGAGLSGPLRAAIRTLRNSEAQDLEQHLRALPGKVNVLMLIFFIPPTLVLMLLPLLLGLGAIEK